MPSAGVPYRPLVSAVIIFFQAERYLEDAVASVLAQTYPEWELLLVDDGSTDGAGRIARRYAAEHPERVRYLHHPERRNRGMSASRNLGLAHARGEYIGFLDADDVWLPHKLERQVEVLSSEGTAQVTFGPTQLWHGWTGNESDAVRDTVREIGTSPGLYEPGALLRLYLRDVALTPATCSVLIRRDAFARIGRFEERFTGLYEDQAFFIKAYLKLSCYVTGEVLDRYRQHDDSHSAGALRAGRYSTERPTPALTGLLFWCARYLATERVADPSIWAPLLRKLAAIGLNRALDLINPGAKRLLALWYGLTGLHRGRGDA
jgi:glycosyltransferase involved in cell wall biosynthesis